MATGTYAPNPVFTGFDDSGDPLASGLLYTYAAGTTTPLATYSNVALTVANPNPVVLDSAGRCTLFLSPTSYKFILKNSAGTTIWSRDSIGAVPGTNIDNDVTGTAGEALTAGQVAYLAGSTWLKADADTQAASTLPVIGFVVADIANGASGTFRLSGRMTDLSGLTPGTDYFVSATAGALTATAPVNARYVGRADSITSLIIVPNPRPDGSLIKGLCQGRLTLTTGVPVTTSDVTAAGTLYFTPYGGNQVGLYAGSSWVPYHFTQLSIAAPAVANQVYDVFLDYNAGTPVLVLTAFTNDTTRATALTTQDGILVKTGATGQRYLGTVRTVTASQFNDSEKLRHVWNYYNRVERPLVVTDATASWTYTSATVRQANGSTANQVSTVVGVAEVPIDLLLVVNAINNTANMDMSVGIGEGSTTTYAAGVWFDAGASTNVPMTVRLVKFPAIGYQFWSWNEWSEALGITTWYGTNTRGSSTTSGMRGTIVG